MESKDTTTNGDSGKPFPVAGILPKNEIQAEAFIRKFQKYDGRGTIVAIFDTGVDPGAPGLEVTTDGKPKIIGCVDSSGSGDVDTSSTTTATNGTITAISGRKLSVDPKWTNPSGQYHLGIKNMYDVFPRPLVTRLKKERKAKWQEQFDRELAALQSRHLQAADDAAKKRLAAEIEQLKAAGSAYSDDGLFYDCVVFHDGSGFCAALLSTESESTDLSTVPLVEEFDRSFKYATFSSADLMNYTINVYNDGNLLEVVITAGTHGTHVAGIVGAYFPDQPELNGVAPGCQMISVKIGDSRLGSMETGTGLNRGLIAALKYKCDLINMSYGEATALPNQGRFSDLANEVVREHGIIFVSSAGNNGPALSTTGAPGATSTALIGVGAYVSPNLMKSAYNMRQTVLETQFTWSSRGPTPDGHAGVCISAPGGAISPVPTWSLQKNRLMNGTSMSSPNACGGIALLVSALKQSKQSFTPHRIRRALECSARVISGIEPFALGRGLLQVADAYEWLCTEESKKLHHNVELGVSTSVNGQRGRGIYLREPHETAAPIDASVTVRPLFKESDDNEVKSNFEVRLRLECAVQWVQHSPHIMMQNQARGFQVRVDPVYLPAGAHFTEILAYDADASDAKSPVFRVPISVIKAEPVAPQHKYLQFDVPFTPARLQRRFYAVPHGATWVDIQLRGKEIDTSRRFVVHAVYLARDKPFQEKEKYITLSSHSQAVVSMAVCGGATLEVCVGQFWSSLGESKVDIEVAFHGLLPDTGYQPVELSAYAVTALSVSSPLGTEFVNPSASFKTARKVLRPHSHQLHPSLPADRNTLPKGRQVYELILTYEFELQAAGKVTPRLPALNGVLYEAEYGAQLWVVLDSNKRVFGYGDSWPSGVQLGKGKYTLKVQVRHDKLDLLDKLVDVPAVVDIPLAKSASVSAYSSHKAALVGGSAMSNTKLVKGASVPVYFPAVPAAIFKSNKLSHGDELLGSVTFGKNTFKISGEGCRPDGFKLHCVAPPAVIDANRAKKEDTVKPAEAAWTSEDALVSSHVSVVERAKGAHKDKAYSELAVPLLAKFPNNLKLLQLQLSYLWSKLQQTRSSAELESKTQLQPYSTDAGATAAGVVAAADRLLGTIDTKALAAFFGVSHDKNNADELRAVKDQEEIKGALIEALNIKAQVYLLDLRDTCVSPDALAAKTADVDAFNEVYTQLKRWKDVDNDKAYVELSVYNLLLAGDLAKALKRLNAHIKSLDASPDRKWFDLRVTVERALGWSSVTALHEQQMLHAFPKKSPLF